MGVSCRIGQDEELFMRGRFFLFPPACSGALVLTALLLIGCVRDPSSAATTEWNLSPEAELSYATLLLDQSIRHDDKAGVLEATELFSRRAVGPQPFIDAVSWLMANGHRAEARGVLEKGVNVYPDSLELHLLLAEIALEDDDPAGAAEIMRAFQAAHPHSELARQEVGILYVKIGRYQEANAFFSALPERLRTPFGRYCHARALSELNRPEEAIRQLRRAVRESPEFSDAWIDLARLLERRGRKEEAAEVYARALEQDPGNQDIWLRLVDMEIKAGRPGKALERVNAGPESFGFQLAAATLFLDARCFTEAEALLLAVSAEPGAPEEVYFYLAALAYEASQDKARTLDFLGRITPANRFYDRALRLRAQLLYEDGRADEALNVVREGESVFPGDRELRLMHVHLLLSAGRRGEALAATEEALRDWPDDQELLFLRGSVLDLLDRKDEALAVMESLLKTAPDNHQALNYIGYTLADANRDLDRALALLEKAVRLAPEQAYILDSLAWAQFRKGRLGEALTNIRRAVALPGGDEWAIWDHYGDIAAAHGGRREARRAWTRALGLWPDNPGAIRAKLEGR